MDSSVIKALTLIFLFTTLQVKSQSGNISCPTYTTVNAKTITPLNDLLPYKSFMHFAGKFSLVGGEEQYNSLFYHEFTSQVNRTAETYYGIAIGSKGAIKLEVDSSGIVFNLTPCLDPELLSSSVFIIQHIDRFAPFTEGFDRQNFKGTVKETYDAVSPIFYPTDSAVVRKILKSVQPYSFKQPIQALKNYLGEMNVPQPDSLCETLFASAEAAVWLNAIKKHNLDARDMLFKLKVYQEYTDTYSFEEDPMVKTYLLRALESGMHYYEDLLQYIRTGEYRISINDKILGLGFPSEVMLNENGKYLEAKVQGKHESITNNRNDNYSFEKLDLPTNTIAGTKVGVNAQFASVFECPYSGAVLKPFTLLHTDTLYTQKGNANYRYDKRVAGQWVVALKKGGLTFKNKIEMPFSSLLLNKSVVVINSELKSENGDYVEVFKKGKMTKVSIKKIKKLLRKSKLGQYKITYNTYKKVYNLEVLHHGL